MAFSPRQVAGIGLVSAGVVGAIFYYADSKTVTPASTPTVTTTTKAPSATPTLSTRPTTMPAAETSITSSQKIKLLTATLTDLESLPGIGPAKAQAILEYRSTHVFKSIDDLDNVKGIGPATITKLRPYLEL